MLGPWKKYPRNFIVSFSKIGLSIVFIIGDIDGRLVIVAVLRAKVLMQMIFTMDELEKQHEESLHSSAQEINCEIQLDELSLELKLNI